MEESNNFRLRKSASVTHARTLQNHSTRVFSDSCWSFVRPLSSNDNFHNNLLLNNNNTLIFHFFWQTNIYQESTKLLKEANLDCIFHDNIAEQNISMCGLHIKTSGSINLVKTIISGIWNFWNKKGSKKVLICKLNEAFNSSKTTSNNENSIYPRLDFKSNINFGLNTFVDKLSC